MRKLFDIHQQPRQHALAIVKQKNKIVDRVARQGLGEMVSHQGCKSVIDSELYPKSDHEQIGRCMETGAVGRHTNESGFAQGSHVSENLCHDYATNLRERERPPSMLRHQLCNGEAQYRSGCGIALQILQVANINRTRETSFDPRPH
jgi:hypothetical protein